jgi:hypothetical protein
MAVTGPNAGSSKPAEAATVDTMRSVWQSIPTAQRPSWEQFQKDFRGWDPQKAAKHAGGGDANPEPDGGSVAGNDGSLQGLEAENADARNETSQAAGNAPEQAGLHPSSKSVPFQVSGEAGARPDMPFSRLEQLAAKGDLKPGETYPVSSSSGQEAAAMPELAAQNASTSPAALKEEQGNPTVPALAQTQRTVTPGDGSSRDKPIAITSAQILESVTVDSILDTVGATAFVIAAKGKIGVQNIPGWTKIPGLKKLGKDAQVDYLAATLTPFDLTSRPVSPLQSTLFLSVTVPGQKPLILTTKLSDMNIEAGRPIKNEPFLGGKIIAFSNWRVGVTGRDGPDGVGSANGGILFRANGLKTTVKQVQGLVKKVTRTAQAAQAATAAAAAPETAATSLAAGAASMAATELVRGTVSNSLGAADWYLGLALRGSANATDIYQASLTVKAQKGPLAGKWVAFKLADIPGEIFESKAPDFEAPNREYLNTAPALKNLRPEIRNALAKELVRNEAKPLLEQLTSYLHVGTNELVDWLNKCDASAVSFAADKMDQLERGPDGRYLLTRSEFSAIRAKSGLPQEIRTIADLENISDMVKFYGRGTMPPMPKKPR